MTKCRLFPALLLMTVLLISALLPPAAFRASAADADVVSAFEQQNVMDDLDGMTIDGKAFSVKDYAFDESKPTQVLMLAEFCYSFYSDRQDDFGLYLYVWNPQGLRFDTDDERNLVQLFGCVFFRVPKRATMKGCSTSSKFSSRMRRKSRCSRLLIPRNALIISAG